MALREAVEGRRAQYKYGARPAAGFQRDITGNDAVERMHERTPPVSHPLVLAAPTTGRRSLYFDPGNRVAAVQVVILELHGLGLGWDVNRGPRGAVYHSRITV